jgi:hypothetical protein
MPLLYGVGVASSPNFLPVSSSCGIKQLADRLITVADHCQTHCHHIDRGESLYRWAESHRRRYTAHDHMVVGPITATGLRRMWSFSFCLFPGVDPSRDPRSCQQSASGIFSDLPVDIWNLYPWHIGARMDYFQHHHYDWACLAVGTKLHGPELGRYHQTGRLPRSGWPDL